MEAIQWCVQAGSCTFVACGELLASAGFAYFIHVPQRLPALAPAEFSLRMLRHRPQRILANPADDQVQQRPVHAITWRMSRTSG